MLDRATPGRLTHLGAQGLVVEKALQGITQRRHEPRIDDEAGLLVGDGFVRTAAATGDLGNATCRGLEEHDSETLCLDPAPTISTARHREDVGTAVERREVVVIDASEELHRNAEVTGYASEPLTVAPASRDHELRVAPNA